MKYVTRILFVLIPLIFIITKLSGVETVDIQLHDTYLVISMFHITTLISIFLLANGVLYELIDPNRLVKILTLFHVALIIFPVVYIFFLLLTDQNSLSPLVDSTSVRIPMMLNLIPVFILGFLILVANIIIGSLLFQKRKKLNPTVLDDKML